VFGDGEGGYQGWGKAKVSLDKRIKPALAPWRIHDLRRTVATVMAESPPDKDHPKARGLGVPPHVVEAMLNHVSGHKAGVAGVYNHATYAREVRAALVMWADHVRSIAGGGERKVVQGEDAQKMTDAGHVFFQNACQYYVAGRYAAFAALNPVAGNLLHHAIEHFLKGGLSKTKSLAELKRLGHSLPKIWAAFKTQVNDPVLADMNRR
jgi:hypothetical protein